MNKWFDEEDFQPSKKQEKESKKVNKYTKSIKDYHLDYEKYLQSIENDIDD